MFDTLALVFGLESSLRYCGARSFSAVGSVRCSTDYHQHDPELPLSPCRHRAVNAIHDWYWSRLYDNEYGSNNSLEDAAESNGRTDNRIRGCVPATGRRWSTANRPQLGFNRLRTRDVTIACLRRAVVRCCLRCPIGILRVRYYVPNRIKACQRVAK